MPLRVILADDHPVVILGARTVLQRAGIEVIAHAQTTDALMRTLEQVACDVLVTDLSMPGAIPDGFALISAIRHQHPTLPIVLLSMNDNAGILRMIANAGVLGLLDKRACMAQLPVAVRAAHQGLPHITPGLLGKIKSAEATLKVQANQPLSARERAALALLGQGHSVGDIPRDLVRSPTTISRQKHSAMRKLKLSTEVGLYDYLRSGAHLL
jgi:two-component system capsular synthesis response regulator RcsB